MSRHVIWLGASSLLLLGSLAAGVGAQAPGATKRVLLLHQAGVGAPIRARFNAAFVEAVRSPDSVPMDLYEEAIEADRFPGPEQALAVIEYLKQKYANRPIDVVVAQGLPPLNFARANRQIFGNPPIVAVATPVGQVAGRTDGVTGLQGGFWISGTLDLALSLLPDTQFVYAIDGARYNQGEVQAEIVRQVSARRKPPKLVYLRDLPITDLLARMAAIPEHAIVLFVRQTMRDTLLDMDQFDALAQVVAVSPAPVFSPQEEFVGRGVVGGYVWRFENDAKRMAQMAKQIVRGVPVSDIPVGRPTYSNMVDWRQLQRWGIPERGLPMDSVLLYRPRSLFEEYRRWVIGGLLVFAAQLALILGLFVQRTRARVAEGESLRALELNRDLAGRLIESQEVERQRIARELHDDVSQKIALLNIEIDQIARQVGMGESHSRLQMASKRAGELAVDVHNLSRELHPSKLQMLGLVAAMQSLCREVSQQNGVDVTFTHHGFPQTVEPNIALCLYRIAQEALHNVARHSQARDAEVYLAREGDHLFLRIADPGVGFDASDTEHAGLGLVSMRERVVFLRGRLAIHTFPGGGTRIGVRIPIGAQVQDTPAVQSYSA